MFPWWLEGLNTLFYVVGADPSREGANIFEIETFSEIFIFFEWCLGGLRIPFPGWMLCPVIPHALKMVVVPTYMIFTMK